MEDGQTFKQADWDVLTDNQLRVLIIEDIKDEAHRIRQALEHAGWLVVAHRVDTEDALRVMLASGEWDVVLSSYSLSRFDALRALAVVREAQHADSPFIIVSESIDAEAAAAAMRAGAHDCVRSDELVRLAATVERELRAAENRAQYRDLKQRLVQAEATAVTTRRTAMAAAHELKGTMMIITDGIEALGWELRRLHQMREICVRSSSSSGLTLLDELRKFMDAEEFGDPMIEVEQMLEMLNKASSMLNDMVSAICI